MIINARLHRVHGETQADAARHEIGQVVRVDIVGVHVFDFGRPIRREEIFETSSHGPTGMEARVCGQKADPACHSVMLYFKGGYAWTDNQISAAGFGATFAESRWSDLKYSQTAFGVTLADKIQSFGSVASASIPITQLPICWL